MHGYLGFSWLFLLFSREGVLSTFWWCYWLVVDLRTPREPYVLVQYMDTRVGVLVGYDSASFLVRALPSVCVYEVYITGFVLLIVYRALFRAGPLII